MMQIIHCVECGGDNIPFGSVSVNVELSKHNHCDKCHRGHSETQTYFFCSEACFQTYVRKVAEGKAEFKFKTYDQQFGQSLE